MIRAGSVEEALIAHAVNRLSFSLSLLACALAILASTRVVCPAEDFRATVLGFHGRTIRKPSTCH